MTREYLEEQLERWKKWLLVCAGAAVTFLTTGVDSVTSNPGFPGWFITWLILQLGTTPAGFMILCGRGWRALPLAARLNTAFGYLSVAWIALIGVGVRAQPSAFLFLVFLFGLPLTAAYLWLRRTRIDAPEEMFP